MKIKYYDTMGEELTDVSKLLAFKKINETHGWAHICFSGINILYVIKYQMWQHNLVNWKQ